MKVTMSKSTEVYTARINTPIHISLTGLSSTSHAPPGVRLICDDASTTFSRLESSSTSGRGTIHPSFNSTARRGSVTLIVRPPVSTSSTGRLYTSHGGRSSVSTVSVVHDRQHARQDPRLDTGAFVGSSGRSSRQRRDAPAVRRVETTCRRG